VLDQVETLYDLDIVLREHACKLGIELVRARALNDGPHMVETLAGLVRRWLGGTEGEAI
jgi:protoheme ferro-lyase